MKRLFIFIIIIITILICLNENTVNAKEQYEIDLDHMEGKLVILHTNDTHGYLLEESERSNDAETLIKLKHVFEAAGAEVLLLDAGDTFTGSPMFKKNRSEPMVELINHIGYDAITLGNHDFDYGVQKLLEYTEKLQVPLLCTNIVTTKDNKPVFDNYKIVEKSNKKIGIFGITTQEEVKGLENYGYNTVKITDPIASSKQMCEELKEEGVDFIIALGHIGMDMRSQLSSVDVISEAKDINLFIDGHSHSLLKLKLIHDDGSETFLVRNLHYFSQIGVVVVDNDNFMKAYTLSKEEAEKLVGINNE